MTRVVKAGWQGAVLVCGKCSKKVGGGFGRKGHTSLAKALRRHLGLRTGRRAALGIVEVKCLGVCPKRRVVVVDGGCPDSWLLVDPGTAPQDVLDALPSRSAGVAPGGLADQGDHVGDALRPVAAELPLQVEGS